MASLTTARVGLNQQTLVPGPVGGVDADQVLIINLDLENTVNLGSSSTNLIFPLGPLASVTLTAPVYAAAATEPLLVGIAPGGTSYSPGSLTITGPVTAEITGPVTVEGTIDIGNSPTVDLAAGATVDISGIADVNVQNANIDVIGAGGFITPGQLAPVNNNATPFTSGASHTTIVSGSPYNVANYSSIVFAQGTMSINSTAANAATCAMWTFTWQDSAGTTVGIDTVSCIIGNVATWEIPVRGSQLTVGLVNNGSTGVITCPAGACIIDGSYRVIPAIRAVNSSLSIVPVITGATVFTQLAPVYSVNGWLAAINNAWSSGALVVCPLPIWVGQVTGQYQVVTSALAHVGTIIDLTYGLQGQVVAGTGYSDGLLANYSGAVNPTMNVSFYAPPTQLAFVYQGTATPGSVQLSLTGLAI